MSDDLPELSPEEQAELDAFEAGAGNTPDRTDPRWQQLVTCFENLPEMKEHAALIARVHDDLNGQEDMPVEVMLSPGFLRLLEHIERKWAAHAGRPLRPTSAVLGQIVANKLHELLHSMAVNPTGHDYFRDLWNDLCAAEDLPTYKIADPMAPAVAEETEGPF